MSFPIKQASKLKSIPEQLVVMKKTQSNKSFNSKISSIDELEKVSIESILSFKYHKRRSSRWDFLKLGRLKLKDLEL